MKFQLIFWESISKYQQTHNCKFSIEDTKDIIETPIGVYKCSQVDCINPFISYNLNNLIMINFQQSHKSIISNKRITINQNLICHTPNVIYKSTINLTTIGGPIKQYVGSTRKTIVHRASQTNSSIRNGKTGNGMTNFCIHYCNQNNFNREDILTYISYEILETVKYTSYPIIDEQMLFQAERKHILENQTCLHSNDNIETKGLNSWDDVEQASGTRKVVSKEIKNAAYTLNSKSKSRQEKDEVRKQLQSIREKRMKIDETIFKKFDKFKALYLDMNIELTDPREL